MKNMKKILIIFLFLNVLLSYGQNKHGDSVKNICPNLFVLGVIEIENPVLISYSKTESRKQFRYENGRTGKWVYSPKSFRVYRNRFLTTKTNIPCVLEKIKNIDKLIYDTNYYVLHRPSPFNDFIHTNITPSCNEEEKKMLNDMYGGKFSEVEERRINLVYKKETVIAKNIYYRTINTNKFLLILVNYDWYIKEQKTTLPPIYTIPYFPIRKGVYIKVLIPLVGSVPQGAK